MVKRGKPKGGKKKRGRRKKKRTCLQRRKGGRKNGGHLFPATHTLGDQNVAQEPLKKKRKDTTLPQLDGQTRSQRERKKPINRASH